MPDAPRSEEWRVLLTEGHGKLVWGRRVFRLLPSAPRCKICNNPFGGAGGRLMALAGFTPSRKNPNVCSRCCDSVPPGGADVDVAVMFADVRGSTGLGEHVDPAAFAGLMNRFYATATDALLRHDAVIDKLIGDEVMAIFVPGISGAEYRRQAVDAGLDLLRTVGYGTASGPWLDLGVAVGAGVAYVGNVGGAVVDFTALGDPVNLAARLQGQAAAGELLVADGVDDEHVAGRAREHRALALRGRSAPVGAYTLTVSD
jgi:adenylate cyclase